MVYEYGLLVAKRCFNSLITVLTSFSASKETIRSVQGGIKHLGQLAARIDVNGTSSLSIITKVTLTFQNPKAFAFITLKGIKIEDSTL